MYKVTVNYRRGGGFTKTFENEKAAASFFKYASFKMSGVSKVEANISWSRILKKS